MITKTLRVPGAELTYDVEGSGPVLLLVPGGPADATAFTALRPQLTGRYTVVTFDPRGISRSPIAGEPGDDLVGEHADDVHRLLTELGGGPAHVFANSGGAITMLEHTQRHPGQVATLVAHEPPISRYLGEMLADFPDIPGIYREQGTDTHLVVAVGKAAAGTPAHAAGLELARALGQEAVEFPGDHGGFAGEPGPFANRLTEVLTHA